MADNVIVQVLGGTKQVLDEVYTVQDVMNELDALNHTATVDGEPADPNDELEDGSFVSLVPAVKGG